MKWIAILVLIFSFHRVSSVEENFLLLNGVSNERILELGEPEKRISPWSTFKIALSLMGFDAGILIDEESPVWPFEEGYDTWLDSWRAPQNPASWIGVSCVWYSKILVTHLGTEKFRDYLAALHYGNQDISGGLTHAWLGSSLEISLQEQVAFIQKMVRGNLPVSVHAVQVTKKLLFLEEWPNGWKLFGKTGGPKHGGWFIGWLENEDQSFPFAYTLFDPHADRFQRISRVKQLLSEVLEKKPLFERIS